MTDKTLSRARDFIKKRSYLVWYTQNFKGLSLRSIVENTLNYGNWKDFLSLRDILGVKKMKSAFDSLARGKRVNLQPRTLNYFSKYFQKYAQ